MWKIIAELALALGSAMLSQPRRRFERKRERERKERERERERLDASIMSTRENAYNTRVRAGGRACFFHRDFQVGWMDWDVVFDMFLSQTFR